MKVELRQIKAESRTFHFSETAEELDIDIENAKFPFPIEVDLNGVLSGDEIIFLVDIKAEIEVECSRCLEIFSMPIHNRHQFVVQLVDNSTDTESDDEDFEIIPKGQTEIDIGPRVRESIILSVPIKALCSENCRGLCPMCGVNLNEDSCDCVRDKTDERWDVLKRLFDNQME